MSSELNEIDKLLISAGLPGDFVDKLIHESDWALVIKLHALFEGVLASLLVRKLGSQSIEDAISHLDFNNAKSGKVTFARALGLLESDEVAFLRGLSELRNQLVHNVRNVSFDLREHIKRMTEPQLKKFKSEFGKALCSTKSGENDYAKYLEERPALIILSAAYGCLLVLQFNIEDRRRKMLVDALLKTTRN